MYNGKTLLVALLSIASHIKRDNESKTLLAKTQVAEPEYDIIIVGAGSAGSTLAGRLSEQSDLSILLMEYGGTESVATDIIAEQVILSTPDSNNTWYYELEPQGQKCLPNKHQPWYWQAHRGLGGGSTMNNMVYNRGDVQRDYEWESMYGAKGWSFRDFLPYFVKSEDNRDPRVVRRNRCFHGKGGPLTVETSPDPTPQTAAFIEAIESLGYQRTDFNGPNPIGISNMQRTMRDGRRCSTVKAFLEPAINRSNLHVLTEAFATKILFDRKKRATSVVYRQGSQYHTVKARKEIILSAGTVGSAKLLLASGVGPAKHLRDLDIDIVADLAGVGQGIQDHVRFDGFHFIANEPDMTTDDALLTLTNLQNYFENSRGPLTLMNWAMFNFKTSAGDDNEDWADGVMYWEPPQLIDNNVVEPDPRHKTEFGIRGDILRPKSRGYIELRSKNPDDPPIIDPKYLTEKSDVDVFVEVLKMQLKIINTPCFRNLNMTMYRVPELDKCCGKFLPKKFKDMDPYTIKYSDEFLRCAVLTYFTVDHHYVGSCRIGEKTDHMAVVNNRLEVLGGVKGLRVVDASIIPFVPSGNTNAPVIAVAEKAADIIKEDHFAAVIKPKLPSGCSWS
ncbi:L-sorbose 1-dehydrogenase-like [Bradysia coprophila]|uniref:L-sorbose 1-dehydrogenase-like n=1 Tax=Bradysia coprophila TaxID=38358 RepID=UPI00187DC43D|nr:L-sorbose 1-dehydrogenase-like [Bradysia coprophila]